MDIYKEIMKHRQRVSLKMSTIANDIAARGRRHDNSYTDSMEYNLIEEYVNADNEDDKSHYGKLIRHLHSERNDYLPEYNDGIKNMNMIQLLELIAEKVTIIDERYGTNNDMDFYKEKVIELLNPEDMSDDLKSIIKNTVEYYVDRNGTIMKSLKKSIELDNINK